MFQGGVKDCAVWDWGAALRKEPPQDTTPRGAQRIQESPEEPGGAERRRPGRWERRGRQQHRPGVRRGRGQREPLEGDWNQELSRNVVNN